MPGVVIGPASASDFAATSSRWEPIGEKVKVQDEDGVHDAYQLGDGSIVGKALRVPSPARLAADAAARSVVDAENARKALIAQRLQERADAHAAQKGAVVTTMAQAQAHVRQIHATLEALCRLQRGDVLSDITG